MVLVKYKNHINYSFIQWMNGCPETNHPNDDENFYCFVKCVCQYGRSKRWKDKNFLKNMILEKKSNFDAKKLENILDTYENLIKFYSIKALPGSWRMEPSDIPLSYNDYLEKGVKDGQLYTKKKIRKDYRN